MSADFNVVLEDLRSMADSFHREAKDYAALKVNVAPPVASSGDAGLDDAIQSMMNAIAGLHAKLAERIDEHGDKLKYAHDSFQRRDVDVHGFFEDLM